MGDGRDYYYIDHTSRWRTEPGNPFIGKPDTEMEYHEVYRVSAADGRMLQMLDRQIAQTLKQLDKEFPSPLNPEQSTRRSRRYDQLGLWDLEARRNDILIRNGSNVEGVKGNRTWNETGHFTAPKGTYKAGDLVRVKDAPPLIYRKEVSRIERHPDKYI